VRGRFFPQAALFLLVLAAVPPSGAQEGVPYLIPQTIFVGDRGRLVVPLGQAFMAASPFVLSGGQAFPRTADLVINRIELEHRNGSARLLIDFIPYAPGILSLPALTVPVPGEAPLELTGLQALTASILAPGEAALSDPAPPLAAPGTGVIIYGSAACILLVFFLALGFTIWGRRNFGSLWERLRRRRLLRAMTRFLRGLDTESSAEKRTQGEFLSILSGELREFLSLFTGINCRSLTAGEFLGFEFYPGLLCALFRRCDTLRFSGKSITREDLKAILAELRLFIEALEKAERERAKEAAGTAGIPAAEAL
jgi:hypothetical protein